MVRVFQKEFQWPLRSVALRAVMASGSGFGPVPAGAFQALGHELFAGGLDHARADLPAVRFGGGVVPVMDLVADVTAR